MALGLETLALARTYTDETVMGGGAIKGKNCTIESIVDNGDGTHTVTFQWTLDDGTVKTNTMTVSDGEKGDKGDKGDTGATGPEGPAGADGKDGKDGKDGAMAVTVTPELSSGVKIAEIEVNGDSVDLFAPLGGELTDDLTTSVKVGGIESGTTYEAGTQLEEIFKDLLNPTAYPTLTNPSATLTSTGTKLLETGASLDTTFTISFNRGSINPAYGTSGYRSGVATEYTFDGETKNTNTFARTVTGEKTSYQGSVSYEAGEQPKDSTGANYSSPLPAGSVNTGTVSYEFVNAIWANTSNISTVAKLSLISKTTKQRDLNFPAQTIANPEIFDIPASWTVTAVQVKNDLSGAYEDASDQFTITDTTHNDAGGTSTAYKRYTFNKGFDTGARSVRIKWS